MKIEGEIDYEHDTEIFADRVAHKAVAAATCGRSLRSRRFDTSGVYRQDYLKDLVQIARPDRIIFG